ncbi:MAG: VWA domain-containing protein [Pyrinomonadaceae bacterium]
MNERHLSLTAAFFLSFALSAVGQTPVPTSTPINDDSEVVKISTDLVQVDAVVTNEKGEPVTELSSGDFQIFQDGKPQRITAFTFVNTEFPRKNRSIGRGTQIDGVQAPGLEYSSIPGRVLTFVVDDGNCNVTMIGMTAAREGLQKFVKEQMQVNDRVAIYQTRNGSSLLQQYTSDKTRLLKTISKIRWYPPGGTCSITGEEFERSRNNSTQKEEAGSVAVFESENEQKKRESLNKFYQDAVATGGIGVLRYAVNGLRNMGGRKVLFFLSDGLATTNGKSTFTDTYDDLRDLAELANRFSVVINSIDVRGLSTVEPQANDDFAIKLDKDATSKVTAAREQFNESRQSGLRYASVETGGTFYRNMNYLDRPIEQALKIEKGYYLIGYEPDSETFKGKKYHTIEVRLNRADYSVSSRSGFGSITDEEVRTTEKTGESAMYRAIMAPLSNSGLDLRVTAFFDNAAQTGDVLKTLVYIGGEQISFTDEPNGMKKGVFDVVAVTLNDKSAPVDEFNRRHTIKFPAANLAEIRQNGLVYSADIPVKKPGVYNFRIVIRDESSGSMGSAGQQVIVPDLKKSDAFLSGLTIGQVKLENGKPVIPAIEKAENAFAPVNEISVPAIRRFSPGMILGYSYKIYNAELSKKGQRPNLTAQIRLYKDGELTTDSPEQPLDLEPQSDISRISDYGYLKLPEDLSIGEYALQIIIRDKNAKTITTNSVDFEVVR